MTKIQRSDFLTHNTNLDTNRENEMIDTKMMQCVEQIEKLDELDLIWSKFVPMLKQLGFEDVTYTAVNRNSECHYYSSNREPAVDRESHILFLEHCCHNYDIKFSGLEFFNMDEGTRTTPKLKKRMKRIAHIGINSELIIPLRLVGETYYGAFAFSSRLKRPEFEAFCKEMINTLQVTCLLVHRRIEAVMFEKRNLLEKTMTVLTAREGDILSKIAAGYSRKKCADTLHLSEGTISTHIKNIYRKLGVNNRVQAINLATRSDMVIAG